MSDAPNSNQSNTPEVVVAIDIDLRRSHAWVDDGIETRGRLFYKEKDPITLMKALIAAQPDVVLIEVASPLMYGGQQYRKKLSWMIYNSVMASYINIVARPNIPGARILVAPSSVWTRGLDEETRHKVANVTASNHDLRECEAMVHFYRKEPDRWVPLADYLEKL